MVGNPIMHHLLLGLDPVELGGAPFALTHRRRLRGSRTRTRHPLRPGAYVYVLPCIAGHVGADTAGVVLSEGPYLKDELTLLVDVGTNAEIVLGNRDRLLACSSPTGPGFRGRADLLRTARRAGRDRAHPHRPRDAGAALQGHRLATCGRTSRASPRRPPRPASPASAAPASSRSSPRCGLPGIITQDGVVDGSLAARTPRVESDRPHLLLPHPRRRAALAVTQNDVRAIQLAKAALYAGIKLLMDRYGVEKVERITLGRRFRQPYRREVRHGTRPDPGLRPGQGRLGRQCRRHRRAHRASQRPRARRDRAASCGASRRSRRRWSPRSRQHFVERHGDPEQDATLPRIVQGGRLPRSEGDRAGRRQRPSQAAARRLSAALPTSLRCNNPVNPSYFLR